MPIQRTYRRVFGIRRWGTAPNVSSHELFVKGGQSNAASAEQIRTDWEPEEGGLDEPDDRILEYSRGRDENYLNLSFPQWAGVPPAGELFRMGDRPNQDDPAAALDPEETDENGQPYGPRGGVSYPLHLSKRRLRRFGNKIQQQLWLNAAQGGTGFSDNRWNPGDDLYQALVTETNQLRSLHPQFDLRAFIFSNSENEMDAGWTGDQFYAAQKALIEGLRNDVTGASDETPFIFTMPAESYIKPRDNPNPTQPGAIPQFSRDIVDASFQLAKDMPNTYYLDHGGLRAPEDGAHFESLQLRAMGAQLEQLLYRIGLVSEAPGPIIIK